jgi:hypothetical protein
LTALPPLPAGALLAALALVALVGLAAALVALLGLAIALLAALGAALATLAAVLPSLVPAAALAALLLVRHNASSALTCVAGLMPGW